MKSAKFLSVLYLCVLALSGCALHHPTLAPLPISEVLTPDKVAKSSSSIARFTQASGLLSIAATQTSKGGESSLIENRFGFFINDKGEIRLDLYPPHGFVALASAVILKDRIIALDRLKKIGIESEQIGNTFAQLIGIALDPNDLVVCLTGKMPVNMTVNLASGVITANDAALLRDISNRVEYLVQAGQIEQVTRIFSNGSIAVLSRDAGPSGYDNLTSSGQIQLSDKHGEPTAAASFQISNQSYTRAVAAKMFTLDTDGYQMHRRLN